jgi:hypothetical protein
MLASLYLPAAFIVRERARAAVAAAPVPDAAKAEAYSRPELSLALPNVLSRIAVLLGPLLAGPIGEFLKSLAG